MNKKTVRQLIPFLFFLAGFAALIYQVVWHRVLTQIIGVDAISITFIVTIFMAGLGFGALFATAIVHRWHEILPRAYVLIEITIGVFGVISIPFIRSMNHLILPFLPGSVFFDFLFNLTLLLIPTFLMGLTSPIIVEIMKQNLNNFGRTAGLFYGVNIFGAAAGSLVTGYLLIELFGLDGSTYIAASLNFIVGISFYAITAGTKFSTSRKIKSTAFGNAFQLDKSLIVASLLLGFSTLAAEMIFFRVLTNYLTLSSYVYPIILSAYLSLMFLGNVWGGRLIDRASRNRRSHLIAMLASLAITLFLFAFLLPPGWVAPLGGMVFTSFSGQLVNPAEVTVGDPNLFIALIFSGIFMLAVIPMAAFFPIVARLASERIEVAGERFASVLFWYTIGNILGSSITGLVFFEYVFTVGALRFTTMTLAIGSGILILRSAKYMRKLQLSASLLILSLLFLNFLVPADYYSRFSYKGYQPTEVIEGRNGVVSVIPTNRFYTIIDMFRTASASAINFQPSPEEEYQAWRWNLSDLMAIDPEFRPKRILIIGLGHGYMVSALLEYDFVEEIVVVDISDEIIEAVETYSAREFADFFLDPRVKIVIEDGRRYIQEAIGKGEKFDLVQNKINEPWHSGSSNLFTEEFFETTKEILNPGGYLAVRHLESHAATGLQVFSTALWTGYYHIYFSDKDFRDLAEARVTEDIYEPFVFDNIGQGNPEPQEARATLSMLVLGQGDLAGYAITRDDRPSFEYYLINNWTHQYADPRTLFNLATWADRVIELPVRYDLPKFSGE